MNMLTFPSAQNIDTLECKAGLKRIMHCHGSFATASCIQCAHRVDCSSIRYALFSDNFLDRNLPGLFVRDEVLADKIPKCPKCRIDKNVMKPDIVFFNEPLSKK